jgi:monoamine oxidase
MGGQVTNPLWHARRISWLSGRPWPNSFSRKQFTRLILVRRYPLPQSLSRRRFLHLVGRAGGAKAAYNTMAAMGLLPVPTAYAGPPDLAPDSGNGVRVVVLGAGIAGLTAAYELSKAGYACTVIEGRRRPGGRNWTIRGGDKVEESDSVQRCWFDVGEHMYFNAGPARIPHHHKAVLGYCKDFGVALEVIVNDNRATYLHSDDAFEGRPLPNRQVIHDSRGFVAELLAKAISKDALAEDVSVEDKDILLAFVRSFGALTKDYSYKGSPRAGYEDPPGAGLSQGRLREPLSFKELLKSDFWEYKLYYSERFEQAATMLQPVGGMDRIAQAFAWRLGETIKYDCVAQEIRKTENGARVIYQGGTGQKLSIEADYVVCTIPLGVLATIANDFAPEFKSAIAACDYVKAAKIAFQADRRFWEEDHQIYGGISWTNRDITQIWYPSAGFHRDKGVLLGAYIWTNQIGERFGRLTPEQRLEAAMISGENIHPGYRLLVSRGVSVCWHKIPYSQGAWADWSPEARNLRYLILNRPDGPIHFAGEHLSYLTGWQEGAVLSAHAAVRAIDDRVKARKG